MAWIERLDSRAAQWPTIARWVYLAVKWSLVIVGAYGVISLLLDRMGILPIFQ